MSGRIVYIVTAGSYSDYRIVAAFDNKAAAVEHAATFKDNYGSGPADVEVFTLNSTQPVEREYWTAFIGPDNHAVTRERVADDCTVWKDTTDDWANTCAGMPCAWYWSAKERVQAEGGYYAEAVHEDKDTAVKIARDTIAQLKSLHATTGATEYP